VFKASLLLIITIASPFFIFFMLPLFPFFILLFLTFFVLFTFFITLYSKLNSVYLAYIPPIVLIVIIDAIVIDISLKRTLILAAILSFLVIIFWLFRSSLLHFIAIDVKDK
jgi:hypothetical protein